MAGAYIDDATFMRQHGHLLQMLSYQGDNIVLDCHYFVRGRLRQGVLSVLLRLVYKEDACVNWEHIPKSVNKDIQQALVEGGVDVSEVYSPPRLTERARRHGLRPGTAMDLATGWDFAVPQQRREALRLLREHQPALIMLCPPCGPFSTMRRLSNPLRIEPGQDANSRRPWVHFRAP